VNALLEVDNVTVSFGSVTAVDNVTFQMRAGTLTGLIGPNGAGKTSFIDALTGMVPSTGTIRFDGKNITRLPTHARARRGLGRTWQSVELFDDLTVLENLEVGTRRYGPRAALRDLLNPPTRQLEASAMGTLDLLGIAALAHRLPGELSYGEKKLVGIARAMRLEPSFILLDEPAAGLDTSESAELGRRLKDVVAQGVGLLLVDHDMGLVLGNCDHIYVLHFGALLAQGPPADIRQNAEVLAAYLGSSAAGESVTTGEEKP
jgi:branched-chain amino acid transport system ATP-binding protein